MLEHEQDRQTHTHTDRRDRTHYHTVLNRQLNHLLQIQPEKARLTPNFGVASTIRLYFCR